VRGFLPLSVDLEREPHEFCFYAQDRQFEKALVNERDDPIHFGPFRAIRGKRRIGNCDAKFAAGLGVFIQKGETVSRRVVWQFDDERRFAFFQHTADGVTIDKRCGRFMRCGMCRRQRRKLPVRRDIFDLGAVLCRTACIAAIICGKKSEKTERQRGLIRHEPECMRGIPA